jgi:hypothetical protein
MRPSFNSHSLSRSANLISRFATFASLYHLRRRVPQVLRAHHGAGLRGVASCRARVCVCVAVRNHAGGWGRVHCRWAQQRCST